MSETRIERIERMNRETERNCNIAVLLCQISIVINLAVIALTVLKRLAG